MASDSYVSDLFSIAAVVLGSEEEVTSWIRLISEQVSSESNVHSQYSH